MLPMLLGSNQQPVSLVLDTGSASLFTDGFQVSASTTACSTGINPIFGYGSGAVEGESLAQYVLMHMEPFHGSV
jgi:hypothetical protein